MYEEKIKNQVERVLKHSQNLDTDLNIDNLMSRWWDSKQKFINRFGGLIYEWPETIEFMLDERDKINRFNRLLEEIDVQYLNPQLADFLEDNKDSFFDNIVTNTDNHPEIPKGMKLIKAFKYFEKNKALLGRMQDLASQYIQENKIKGKLCFSVHPLDFLSSSENTYHWRSCHALDGEYCAGNLSYMVDETTFIVYLKGEEEAYLPNFPNDVKWNSKKWRVLLYAEQDDRLLFAGRQYPFSSHNGLDVVLNIYNNLIAESTPNWYESAYKYHRWNENYIDSCLEPIGPYEEEVHLNDRYLVYFRHLIGLNQLIKDGEGSLQYNDLLFSTCYKYPAYSVLDTGYSFKHPDQLLKYPIEVGRRVRCIRCGMDDIEDSGTMLCPDCEQKYGDPDDDYMCSCACCDSRIYTDDAYYVGYYDEPVCDYCFTHHCFICDNCEEAFFKEDECITVKSKDGDPIHLCKHCHEELKEEI